MANLTIRQLDDSTKEKLRVRAAKHRRSMEEEARQILRTVLMETPRDFNLVDAIQRRFRPLGGMELKLPARDGARLPPIPE